MIDMTVKTADTKPVDGLQNTQESGAPVRISNQSDRIITGANVTMGLVNEAVLTGDNITDSLTYAILEEMIQSEYEAQMAVVDNLKPSDESYELALRRQEELEELLKKVQDQEIDLQQAYLQLVNSKSNAILPGEQAEISKTIATETKPMV